MNIGLYICELRKKQGMTQKELGTKVNLPQQYISKIEKNKVQIKLITFIEILEALGKDFQLCVK